MKAQRRVRAAIMLGAVLVVSFIVGQFDDHVADDQRVVAGAQSRSAAAGVQTWAVALRERNRSGRSGTAALVPSPDGGTRIRIELSGPPDTPVSTVVVVGTCASQGEARFTLSPIAAGRSETTLPIALQDLLNGKFSIRTTPADDPAKDLSCGEVVGG